MATLGVLVLITYFYQMRDSTLLIEDDKRTADLR